MGIIKVSQEHIQILRDFRFFAAPPHLADKQNAKLDSFGWIKVGQSLHFRADIEIEPYSGIYVGPYRGGKGAGMSSGFCTIGALSYSHSPLPDKMHVGRYCSIGEGLKVLDSHHPLTNISTSHFTWRTSAPAVQALCNDKGITMPKQKSFPINGLKAFPRIKNDVWIGQNVTLSMGIEIGNGAVVAANSVVTKSVPDYAIVGGNPAKIIKYRFSDEQIQQLKQMQWWNYIFTDFKELNFQCIDTFIQQWKELDETIQPYTPSTLKLPHAFM